VSRFVVQHWDSERLAAKNSLAIAAIYFKSRRVPNHMWIACRCSKGLDKRQLYRVI
jgi:hypothetical protein